MRAEPTAEAPVISEDPQGGGADSMTGPVVAGSAHRILRASAQQGACEIINRELPVSPRAFPRLVQGSLASS